MNNRADLCHTLSKWISWHSVHNLLCPKSESLNYKGGHYINYTSLWNVVKELTYCQGRNGNAHSSLTKYISKRNMRVCKYWSHGTDINRQILSLLGQEYKHQAGRVFLAFEIIELEWYEVGVRSNLGGNKKRNSEDTLLQHWDNKLLTGRLFWKWIFRSVSHFIMHMHLLLVIYYKLFWLLRMDKLDKVDTRIQWLTHKPICCQMVRWFGLVLWHINHCRLTMPNPFLYILWRGMR